jgi:DinB superfamily
MSEQPPTRDQLLAALAGFPLRLAAAARAAAAGEVIVGAWTPEQIARHLIAVELEVHQRRLHDLVTTDAPTWSWQEPAPWPNEPGLGLDGVLEHFRGSRDVTVTMFRSLDDVGWSRAGRHATFGRLDADGLLWLAVDHDEEHLGGLGRG